jgi:hypothetical protein
LVVYGALGALVTAWLAGTAARDPLTLRFACWWLPVLCLWIARALTGGWHRLARAGAAVLLGLGAMASAAVHLGSFLRSPRDEAGAFLNANATPGGSICVPPSPGPYEMPAFDFSRLRLVCDSSGPADYVVEVGHMAEPPPAAGTETLAVFPTPAFQPRTPLSFSGRVVAIYRRTAQP